MNISRLLYSDFKQVTEHFLDELIYYLNYRRVGFGNGEIYKLNRNDQIIAVHFLEDDSYWVDPNYFKHHFVRIDSEEPGIDWVLSKNH